jgi:hypothetical protein
MRRMFDEVGAAAVGAAAVGTGFGGLMSIVNAFRGRPLAFQAAAAAGALVLFGALGLGASAATGNGPAPVREFFGISSSSAIRVEFLGTIVSIEPATNTLVVSANGDMRTVIVGDHTEITGSGQALTLDDLSAGQLVEVKGTLQSDNTIAATRLHLEDAGAEPTVPAVDVPTAPAAVPTTDDRDDDGDDDGFEDDNDGPDDGDDNGDDNSGPGGDDDHGDDDNPGGGDDDRAGDDDGPDDDGPSDDDGTDDHDDDSGPGGGDDSGDD